jgi:hypothetical protein
LLAHILERLEQLRRLGHEAAGAPLARRASEVGEALAAVEARRGFDDPAAVDAGAALEILRREEMTRVVLRADLLRTMSRLTDLSLAVARADAHASADETARLGGEIRELALAADAELEVGALLRGPR